MRSLFTSFDPVWSCDLFSQILGEDVSIGSFETSDLLFEEIHDNMKFVYAKPWALAGLISFEPYHHLHTPYHFILCGNTEQAPTKKVIPFAGLDYSTRFGKVFENINNTPIIPPKFACTFVSNPMCDARNRFMRLLLSHGLLDSYGKVYQNVESSVDSSVDSSVESSADYNDMNAIIRQYKFYICFENSQHEAYITEKPYDGLRNGVIPVYYGATIDYFNPERVIVVRDASDEGLQKTLQRMIEISQSDDKWISIVQQPIYTGSSNHSPNSMESYATAIRDRLSL